MERNPKVIVHRAGGFLGPENTIYAMEQGLALPVDGIEIDVQFTKDHVPVVYHDDHTKRTTKTRKVVKRTLYNELKDLDNGSWFDKSLTDVRISTLEEFLQAFQGRTTLYLEIKAPDKHLLDIPKLLQEYGLIDKVIILSFHFQVLTDIKDHYPEITTMFLMGARWRKKLSYAIDPRIDWYGLSFRLAYKKHHFVQEILSLGYPVNIWSCNKMDIAETLIDLGITSITTDRPEEMLELIKKRLSK